jgi:hypothetical protein
MNWILSAALVALRVPMAIKLYAAFKLHTPV